MYIRKQTILLIAATIVAAIVATVLYIKNSQVIHNLNSTSLDLTNARNNASVASFESTSTVNAQEEALSPRELYSREVDRAKIFALLEKREEPEAKYFAYRAAGDCHYLVRGTGNDWNNILFEARSEFSNTAQNRALDKARHEALTRLEKACRGFTRPNEYPTKRMAKLLEEAASAGHPAAIAAIRWAEYQSGKTPISMELLDSIGQTALESSDFFAMSEAEGAILAMRHNNLIAGLGARDLDALTAAFELAECSFTNTCGRYGVMADIYCVTTGRCGETAGQYLYQPLTSSQLAAAQDAAKKIVSAVVNKEKLLTPINKS